MAAPAKRPGAPQRIARNGNARYASRAVSDEEPPRETSWWRARSCATSTNRGVECGIAPGSGAKRRAAPRLDVAGSGRRDRFDGESIATELHRDWNGGGLAAPVTIPTCPGLPSGPRSDTKRGTQLACIALGPRFPTPCPPSTRTPHPLPNRSPRPPSPSLQGAREEPPRPRPKRRPRHQRPKRP